MKEQHFGTDNISTLTSDELLNEVLKLMSSLHSINLSRKINITKTEDQSNKELVRLLEIIKFGKEKFPYLLSLSFDQTGHLLNMQLRPDPHYDNTTINTAFDGPTIDYPDLAIVATKPTMLIRDLKLLFDNTKNNNFTFGICGNEDCVLILGKLNTIYLKDIRYKPISNTPVAPQLPAKA